MGKITLSTMSFKPAAIVYSKVKRRLNSYGMANTIDEGEFPVYAKDVLDKLGFGVLMESRAVVEVINNKACLPDNFKYLYAAFKCTPDFTCDNQTRTYIQNSSFSYVTDITDQIAINDNNCEIGCVANNSYLETVSVNNYVKINPSLTFSNFQALTVVPDLTSPSPFMNCISDISINDNILSTVFDNGFVFIQYYGFPVDSDGELLVPDVKQIEEAVEWCIIYEFLLSAWFNSSIPDIQNKWQVADSKYREAFITAKNYLKIPSFAQMVNSIRSNSQNMLSYMTKEYNNTNFQKT